MGKHITMAACMLLGLVSQAPLWAEDQAPASPAPPPSPVLRLPASAQLPEVKYVFAEPCARGCLNPIEAVTYASYLGERAGVAAEFEMTVRAVGEDKGVIFLNSETDYRDRNCLTIALPIPVAEKVFGTARLDQLRSRLVGKSAVFSGVARQVRIDLISDGKPTGKFYYQVHLRVLNPGQALRLPKA